ncbi:MAG: carboxypeptidase regulatory-like domain-containing protein [Armatimonadota bacterium]|nr:carboxypeptidase regulatory-like domain-containing protein [Armatimonadota bacterium]
MECTRLRLALVVWTVLMAVAVGAETLTISGTVVTPDGQPAAGATVFTNWYFVAEPRKYDLVQAETAAGADGAFELTLEGEGEPIERWAVGAMMDGYGLGWAVVERPETEGVVIRLHEPATVAGRVIDSDGEPVEGAQVTVQEISAAGDRRDSIHPSLTLQQTTGPDGRFEFPGMPEDTLVRMSAGASGYALHFGSEEPVATMGDVEITLMRGGVITGRVTRDGEPVPEVRVWSRREQQPYERSVAATDEQGTFALDQMKAGVHTVYVDAPEGWTAAPIEHVAANAGEPVELPDIELIRGGVVSGLVSDGETGEPVTKVTITAYASEDDFPFAGFWTAHADAEGHYELRLPPGRYWLHADGRGAGYQYRGEEPWLHEVQVAEGESAELNIPLTPMARLTGTVVDAEGAPVEGALIMASEGVSGDVRTDAEGRFRLSGEGEDVTALLAISEERGLVGRAVVRESSDQPRITLEPGAWATLTMVDPARQPIEGQHVSCSYTVWDAERTYGRTVYAPRQHTDDDGRVRLGPLPGGVELELWCYDAQPFIVENDWSEAITLQPGEERDVGRVVVDRSGATIAGRVLDIDGEPVEGALVIDMVSGQETRSNEHGRFALTGLPFSRHGAPTPDYRAFLVAGLLGEDLCAALPDFDVSWEFDAQVTLEPLGSVTGRLVQADGTPVGNVRVDLWPLYSGRTPRADAGRFGKARLFPDTLTGDDGGFRFDGLIPGVRYTILVRDDEGGRRSTADEIVPDPGKTIDLGEIRPRQ